MSTDIDPDSIPARSPDYWREKSAQLRAQYEREVRAERTALVEQQRRQFSGNRHERRRHMALQRKKKGTP